MLISDHMNGMWISWMKNLIQFGLVEIFFKEYRVVMSYFRYHRCWNRVQNKVIWNLPLYYTWNRTLVGRSGKNVFFNIQFWLYSCFKLHNLYACTPFWW